MENRQPTYPGRVVLTPVPGAANTYDMTRADDPTVEGTPLNKETLLQDATCAILDIPDTSVPNDAFVKLALGIGKYGYVIHVQYPDGSPAEGFTLTGLNAPDGTSAVTNSNGDAVGVSTAQSVTIGVSSPYIDIQDVSGVVVQSTGILTSQTITVEPIDGYATITTSKTVSISPIAETFDACCVGGGGPGGGGISGTGGGGGYATNALAITCEGNRTLAITIGAGGQYTGASAGQPAGSVGGTTAITSGQTQILSANGGNPGRMYIYNSNNPGGVGNGNGGGSDNSGYGGNSGIHIFNDSNLPLAGGGGGSAGQSVRDQRLPGGKPYGGYGAGDIGDIVKTVNATAGRGPGGGGGGGGKVGVGTTHQQGANGASGAVYLRFHYLNNVSA